MVPQAVLEAYGFAGQKVEPVSGGLINATYVVRGDNGIAVVALQRLHPVFSAEVNIDIDAVTSHLAKAAFPTPQLVRTVAGHLYVAQAGHTWRALSWVEGQCFDRISEPSLARAGAMLVGRFHRALLDLDHDFVFTRAGVHDTAAHLERLRGASADASKETPHFQEARELRERILEEAERLPTLLPLPLRICHGDLKISNLLFDSEGQGLCLIDLDTMGRQTMAYELGDALRSWANPAGEDKANPSIDRNIVAATARGYAQGSDGLLSPDEIEAVIPGLQTICLELAARFCVDIFEDSYFGWDAERFPSRQAHNAERGRGQLALCRSVSERRGELEKLWREAF